MPKYLRVVINYNQYGGRGQGHYKQTQSRWHTYIRRSQILNMFLAWPKLATHIATPLADINELV